MNAIEAYQSISSDPSAQKMYNSITGRKALQTILNYEDTIGFLGALATGVVSYYVVHRLVGWSGAAEFLHPGLRYTLEGIIDVIAALKTFRPASNLGVRIGVCRINAVNDGYLKSTQRLDS